MTGALTVHQVGPAVTVQDLGRPGHLSSGLSCGGLQTVWLCWRGPHFWIKTQASPALKWPGWAAHSPFHARCASH